MVREERQNPREQAMKEKTAPKGRNTEKTKGAHQEKNPKKP